MATVAILGTLEDLDRARLACADVLRQHRHSPNFMEDWRARSTTPLETCREEMSLNHGVCVIIAEMYGSLVPGGAFSYTEMEVREALRTNKPMLVFVLDRKLGKVRPVHVERGIGTARLDAFKLLLGCFKTLAFFKDVGDLRLKFSQSLDELDRQMAEATSNTSILESFFDDFKPDQHDGTEIVVSAEVSNIVAGRGLDIRRALKLDNHDGAFCKINGAHVGWVLGLPIEVQSLGGTGSISRIRVRMRSKVDGDQLWRGLQIVEVLASTSTIAGPFGSP